MLKLLIVEDERWEREGLRDFLDWNHLGIEIAGLASDGIEGVQAARDLLPDIIISDIKMPGLNGLEMCRQIKLFLPNVKLIMLTGYDDFNFAKEAIHFNVFDYLLKPIEEKELLEVIEKVVLKCSKERKDIDIIHNKLYLDLFMGHSKLGHDAEAVLGVENSLNTSHVYTVLAIQPLTRQGFTAAELIMLKSYFSQACMMVTSNESTEDNLICLSEPSNEWERISPIIDNLQRQFQLNHSLEIVIGAGEFTSQLADIHESCTQAKRALSLGLFWQRPGWITYRQAKERKAEFYNQMGDFLTNGSQMTKKILQFVKTAEITPIIGLLEEWFTSISQYSGAEGEFIGNYLFSLVNESALLLYSLNENMGFMDGNEDDLGKKLVELPNMQVMKAFVIGYFETILSNMDDIRNNKDDSIIKKVIQLVDLKYNTTEISLKLLSGEIFLSPNYLGTMFRKAMGQSFNDYLTEYRMEKAKKLLHSAKNKVSWVAKEVGMPNTSYFCTVFKNTVGMAPGEYQETICRN